MKKITWLVMIGVFVGFLSGCSGKKDVGTEEGAAIQSPDSTAVVDTTQVK